MGFLPTFAQHLCLQAKKLRSLETNEIGAFRYYPHGLRHQVLCHLSSHWPCSAPRTLFRLDRFYAEGGQVVDANHINMDYGVLNRYILETWVKLVRTSPIEPAISIRAKSEVTGLASVETLLKGKGFASHGHGRIWALLYRYVKDLHYAWSVHEDGEVTVIALRSKEKGEPPRAAAQKILAGIERYATELRPQESPIMRELTPKMQETVSALAACPRGHALWDFLELPGPDPLEARLRDVRRCLGVSDTAGILPFLEQFSDSTVPVVMPKTALHRKKLSSLVAIESAHGLVR